MEKYTRRLKQLTEEEGLTWCYAPLHRFLNEPELAK
jgi:hypothetical protein